MRAGDRQLFGYSEAERWKTGWRWRISSRPVRVYQSKSLVSVVSKPIQLAIEVLARLVLVFFACIGGHRDGRPKAAENRSEGQG